MFFCACSQDDRQARNKTRMGFMVLMMRLRYSLKINLRLPLIMNLPLILRQTEGMKKLLALAFLWTGFSSFAQTVQRPRLIVGIVVDQMRWDFLYRYDRYGSDGFQRLLREGFSWENTFIPYMPTYTAPGHSCIYTGSVPSLHGIIGNNWYDRPSHKLVYCTDDSAVNSVGSSSAAGRMSPRNLWANTITDELRLSNNFKSRTIAIALKDRSSILPGGHTANGAYWFDNATGGFITSTFYRPGLPDWVSRFNARKWPDTYL